MEATIHRLKAFSLMVRHAAILQEGHWFKLYRYAARCYP
jgi:hypothetical protein